MNTHSTSQDAWLFFVGLDIQAKPRLNTFFKKNRPTRLLSVTFSGYGTLDFCRESQVINVGSARPASASTSSIIRLMLIMRVTEMVRSTLYQSCSSFNAHQCLVEDREFYVHNSHAINPDFNLRLFTMSAFINHSASTYVTSVSTPVFGCNCNPDIDLYLMSNG